ncbi:MAG: hypothetical protein U5Q03_11390 [Bacteroidota bacterium]|nr:hypothetical protein [Bacteroidota bacterium]
MTKKQCADSGMALILILLLLAYWLDFLLLYELSIPLLVLLMIAPGAFYPFAVIWMAFTCLLGKIVPKILLGLIFYGLVLPVGLIRRWMGKDDLDLKKYRKGKNSSLHERNKTYTFEDITKPF